MMVLPPVAGVNVGRSSGGGFLDSIKQAVSGATGQTTTQVDPGPKGDGSVGLFDGVLKKALFGGAAGAAMGFLPFIPGGPVLGGIVGALGGAAMGVFSNWKKQQDIKAENQATLAALGVQVNDPQIQQVLQSGNVSQLIPMMQSGQQTGGVGQTTTQTTSTPGQVSGVNYGDVSQAEIDAMQQRAIAEGKTPGQVVPVQQSVIPTQAAGTGGGAVNPAVGVNPGVAPALAGGGGAAGDVGRPAAPTGVSSTDVSAIAPRQAGIGMSTSAATDATAGTASIEAASATNAQLLAMIQRLDQQIKMLTAILEQRQREDASAAQAA